MTASKGAKAKGKPRHRANRTPLRARARREWGDRLLSALREGLTRSTACSVASVPRQTFYDRLNSDPEFLEAVEAAEDTAAVKHERNIVRASEMDHRASLEWLRVRRPNEWGRKQEVTHSGRVGVIAPSPAMEALLADPDKLAAFDKLIDGEDSD